MTSDTQEEQLLLRMLPEQVSDKWNLFAPLIEKSLPPTVVNGRRRMANVLRSVLMDELVVWVYQGRESEEAKYVVTTLERTEPVSLTKDLLIYSFTGLGGHIRPDEVQDGFSKLAKYAKSRGCLSIVAYANEQRIIDFLVANGAKADYSFIQISLL